MLINVARRVDYSFATLSLSRSSQLRNIPSIEEYKRAMIICSNKINQSYDFVAKLFLFRFISISETNFEI